MDRAWYRAGYASEESNKMVSHIEKKDEARRRLLRCYWTMINVTPPVLMIISFILFPPFLSQPGIEDAPRGRAIIGVLFALGASGFVPLSLHAFARFREEITLGSNGLCLLASSTGTLNMAVHMNRGMIEDRNVASVALGLTVALTVCFALTMSIHAMCRINRGKWGCARLKRRDCRADHFMSKTIRHDRPCKPPNNLEGFDGFLVLGEKA